MRKLENKKINVTLTLTEQFHETNELVVVEKKEGTTYFKLLHNLCKVPPIKGWNLLNIDALKTRMELVEKLANEKATSVQLEETQYKSLTDALGENGGCLMFTTKESAEFLSYIKNLPKVDPAKK